MSDVAQKHAHINIYIDIVCAVVIRIDKMGFHRRYDFACLYAGDLLICRSWGDAVEWCEIFNAFCRNALSKNTEYPIDNSIVFDYGLHNGSPTLRMLLKNRTGALQQYTFSKLECLQIYSKMSKILSKCDLVSQGGY